MYILLKHLFNEVLIEDVVLKHFVVKRLKDASVQLIVSLLGFSLGVFLLFYSAGTWLWLFVAITVLIGSIVFTKYITIPDCIEANARAKTIAEVTELIERMENFVEYSDPKKWGAIDIDTAQQAKALLPALYDIQSLLKGTMANSKVYYEKYVDTGLRKAAIGLSMYIRNNVFVKHIGDAKHFLERQNNLFVFANDFLNSSTVDALDSNLVRLAVARSIATVEPSSFTALNSDATLFCCRLGPLFRNNKAVWVGLVTKNLADTLGIQRKKMSAEYVIFEIIEKRCNAKNITLKAFKSLDAYADTLYNEIEA